MPKYTEVAVMQSTYKGFKVATGPCETIYDKHVDPDRQNPLTVVAKKQYYMIAINQAGEAFQLRETEVARYRHA